MIAAIVAAAALAAPAPAAVQVQCRAGTFLLELAQPPGRVTLSGDAQTLANARRFAQITRDGGTVETKSGCTRLKTFRPRSSWPLAREAFAADRSGVYCTWQAIMPRRYRFSSIAVQVRHLANGTNRLTVAIRNDVVAVATLAPGGGPAVVRFAPAYCARG